MAVIGDHTVQARRAVSVSRVVISYVHVLIVVALTGLIPFCGESFHR